MLRLKQKQSKREKIYLVFFLLIIQYQWTNDYESNHGWIASG